MMNFEGLKSFSLDEVYLENAYFVNALEKEVEYLTSFDVDRLLAGFRETAGVDMRGAVRYDGWENMLIGGHTMGHYMSACVHAYESANVSQENKDKLYNILKALLEGMDECQKARRSGFLFGAVIVDKDNVEKQFDNVEEGKANIITEAWVPWYTMHKILEGLVSVMQMPETLKGDSRRVELHEKAHIIGTRLGNWVFDRTNSWSEETRRIVLGIEYGGMNDVMYDLYLQTGVGIHRMAAEAFDQVALFEEVYHAKKGDNVLNNRHANTTIPKFMGALKRYVVTGEEQYLEYAKAFWNMVSEDHTYITGGNSEWEHFGEDDILDAERTNCNCETCNAYNMLKMTKLLHMITGDVRYADWYENTFLNSIMSSQNPETGMTTYFQPMASGYFKVYGEPFNRFWCCTGSGMENFTKLGESFYFAKDNMLVVNQYIASSLEWKAQNVIITQITDIPKTNTSTLRIENYFEGMICLRLPEWLAAQETIVLNGQPVNYTTFGGDLNDDGVRGGYAVLEGIFHSGDEITITLPMKVRAYALPDGGNTYAFKYGPVVLSALLGTKDMEKTITGVDVIIPQNRVFEKDILPSESEVVTILEGTVADFMANIDSHMERCEESDEFLFRLTGTDSDLSFVTHYKQHKERYGLYFRYVDASSKNELEDAKNQKAILLERYRLDTVQPGYGQYENDSLHNMMVFGTGSTGTTEQGTKRHANAGGSFCYTMLVDINRTSLMATFTTKDNGKSMRILAGEAVIYDAVLDNTSEEEYYDVIIPISREILLSQSVRTEVMGVVRDVMTFTIEGAEEKESANLCNFLYTVAYMP
ncbi:MAG: glycoside hydrolase family 127 protein [Agathobacter sp.]|nr:glycoside hydrolase family 127 protein [Agathobacter sp.]